MAPLFYELVLSSVDLSLMDPSPLTAEILVPTKLDEVFLVDDSPATSLSSSITFFNLFLPLLLTGIVSSTFSPSSGIELVILEISSIGRFLVLFSAI